LPGAVNAPFRRSDYGSSTFGRPGNGAGMARSMQDPDRARLDNFMSRQDISTQQLVAPGAEAVMIDELEKIKAGY